MAHQGRFKEAETHSLQALNILQSQLGEDHPNVAACCSSLGLIYQADGRFAEAESMHRRALTHSEQQLGATHPGLGSHLNNLGLTFLQLAQFDEAEALFLRATAILCESLGPHHPVSATSRYNLGLVYEKQNRLDEAEASFTSALAVLDHAFGPSHSLVGSCLDSLGGICKSHGRLADAEDFYIRALSIRESSLGAEHPDVATSLTNIALLRQRQARSQEAAMACDRALAIQSRSLGEHHPEVAVTFEVLGKIHSDAGEFEKAASMCRQVLAIREQALGRDHPDTARAMTALATTLSFAAMSDSAEIVSLYRRALEILERTLGPNHPGLADVLHNLGLHYRNTGDTLRAKSALHRSISLYEQSIADKHVLGSVYRHLAAVFRDQERFKDAEPFLLRSMDLLAGCEPPDEIAGAGILAELADGYFRQDDTVAARATCLRARAMIDGYPGGLSQSQAIILNNVGACLFQIRDYAEAEVTLKQAIACWETSAPNDEGHSAALRNLANLYFDMDNFAPAATLYVEAQRILEKHCGQNHPGLADILEARASLELTRGRSQAADKLIRQANQIKRRTS